MKESNYGPKVGRANRVDEELLNTTFWGSLVHVFMKKKSGEDFHSGEVLGCYNFCIWRCQNR